MEIVVVPQGNGSLSSIAKTGVKFMACGSTAITGSYQGLRIFTASYTNINPIITSLDMVRGIPDLNGFQDTQSVLSPGTTTPLKVTGPIASGGQVLTTATTAESSQTVRQTISGSAATYGLDLGATLLPWVEAPSYDPQRGKIVVPVDTTGTTSAKPDMFRVVMTYKHTDANHVTSSVAWTLFGPDAGDVALPTLPPRSRRDRADRRRFRRLSDRGHAGCRLGDELRRDSQRPQQGIRPVQRSARARDHRPDQQGTEHAAPMIRPAGRDAGPPGFAISVARPAMISERR